MTQQVLDTDDDVVVVGACLSPTPCHPPSPRAPSSSVYAICTYDRQLGGRGGAFFFLARQYLSVVVLVYRYIK